MKGGGKKRKVRLGDTWKKKAEELRWRLKDWEKGGKFDGEEDDEVELDASGKKKRKRVETNRNLLDKKIKVNQSM